jgi:hypothetical protein
MQWLCLAALLAAIGAQGCVRLPANPVPALTGAQTGKLAGKLTDIHGKPVLAFTLRARSESTGFEAYAVTGKGGAFLFPALNAGDYTLMASSPRLGDGRLTGIQVQPGQTNHFIVAMDFVPQPHAQQASQQGARDDSQPIADSGAKLAAPEAGQTESATPQATLSVAAVVSRPEAMPATPAFCSLSKPSDPPQTSPADVTALLPAQQLSTIALPAQSLRQSPKPSAVAASKVASLDVQVSPNPAVTTSILQRASLKVPPTLAESDAPFSSLNSSLTGAELQSLPAPGRRWQDFVLDTPPAPAANTNQGSAPNVLPDQMALTVDGANRRLAFGSDAPARSGSLDSSSAGFAHPSAGSPGLNIAEVAIRTVETVAANVDATGANASGGRLNVQTEGGTNGLHGQGFLSDRQNSWGARNPFTQWVKETSSAAASAVPVFTGEPYTPPDHELVWGFGVGRHIRRDKLFWFVALDSYHRNDPAISTVRHPELFFAQPTNDQMQVLSARLGLPAANPLVEGVGAYSKILGTLAGLLGPAARTSAQWVGFARLDGQLAERHRFTLEGIGADWSSPGGGLTRTSEPYGNHSLGSSYAAEQWLLGRWEAYLNPNLLLTSQASAGHDNLEAKPETPSQFEQTLLAGNVWGQLPQIVVDSRYGMTIGNPSRFGSGSYPNEHLYQVVESLDWVHGNLLLKAGFDVSHNTDATGLIRNQTGTYYYTSAVNFASDTLAFASFGVNGQLNPFNQHNCDQTGKVWRDSAGTLHGLGYLPCYSYYSQVIGQPNWSFASNDWAGFVTTQWQPRKLLVTSFALRWEREQAPPSLAVLANPALPLAGKPPTLGSQWGPRVSLAFGNAESRWPVFRLGYGMYFGRTENSTFETMWTQTGSLQGDLSYFLRPTDNLGQGGAPPFPHVLNGAPGSVVKPGAVEFGPGFRNPEVHQAVAALEEALPGHFEITASALLSLGRRLPFSVDTNLDPAVNPGKITYAVVDPSNLGPIRTSTITVPFYASWPSPTSSTGFAGRLHPDYQQIVQLDSRANSTWEAAMITLNRYSRRGLSIHAHYTYSHAMDWNPNESAQVTGSDPLDPADFKAEYGTGNLDTRHALSANLIYQAPWKFKGGLGRFGNGWMLSSILQARSGEPYTMRTSGSLAKEFLAKSGTAIVALGPGMNGSGGDNRVYGIGRNTFRYTPTWKMDLRVARRFNLGHMRDLELLAESFNLMNHQNVTELETVGYTIESGSTDGTAPTLTFLNGLKANTTAFGQPLNVNATNFYRERQIQFGARLRF